MKSKLKFCLDPTFNFIFIFLVLYYGINHRIESITTESNEGKRPFLSSWKEIPKYKDWLDSDKNDLYAAFCIICKLHLTCKRSVFDI